MKKVLLVCALVLCFINLGKVFAFDDQEVDLYDDGTSLPIISLGMFNNRLYSSSADNSIYWVIDKVTFDSQQYWYVYGFLTDWLQPIDTLAYNITDFYSYLDIEETIIIFNIKLWQTVHMHPWNDDIGIGIFSTNTALTWVSLNGRVYTSQTYEHKNNNTIQDLVINLNSSNDNVDDIKRLYGNVKFADGMAEMANQLSSFANAAMGNNISLTIFLGNYYVWDSFRDELLYWDYTYDQYRPYDDTFGYKTFYDYITPLKQKYALLTAHANYTEGHEAGLSTGYATGKTDGIVIGFKDGVLDAYEKGFEYHTDGILANLIEAQSYTFGRGYGVGELIGQLKGNEGLAETKYNEGFADGSAATEPEAYNAGYTDGYANTFANGFKDWIVPAIAVVIIGGGIMSVISIKKRKEDL